LLPQRIVQASNELSAIRHIDPSSENEHDLNLGEEVD
jgi:hypothetical protein